jgi:hypothetical protein
MTTPHARLSDPISSEIAVGRIAKNTSLKDNIRYAAERLHPQWFDDTDLLELVEEQTGRRQQRNVIARSRGLMERDGEFIRMGLVARQGRQTVHFCLPGGEQPSLFDEHGYTDDTPEWTL